MKKALIILRVSDEKQEERNSLDKQEEQALDYCKFKGYTVYKTLKTVVSGRKVDRTDFLELEEEVEKNSFDVLVFYELSRLARNAYFIHKLVHNLKQKEIEFESITESYLNSDSPTSKIMLGIMASQAEVESDMISKRVRNRMKFYASQGYFLFKPPLGYRLEDKILYPNEKSEVIKEIYQGFIQGTSIKKLSKQCGVSTTGIKRILLNVTYIGKIKFGFEGKNNNTGKRVANLPGEIFDGKHEPIIDIDTFKLAQSILETHSHIQSKSHDNDNILSGIMLHQCGKMYGKKTLDGYRLYVCRKCYKSISAEKIEKSILSTIKEYAENIDFLGLKNKKSKKPDNKSKIRGLLTKKDRIIETYSDGFISRDSYLKKLKKIDEEILELSKVPILENEDITLKEKLINDIKELDTKSNEEKKQLILLFLEKIEIDEEGNPEITFKF